MQKKCGGEGGTETVDSFYNFRYRKCISFNYFLKKYVWDSFIEKDC